MLIPVIKSVHSPFFQKYNNLEMFKFRPGFSHDICWQKSMHVTRQSKHKLTMLLITAIQATWKYQLILKKVCC